MNDITPLGKTNWRDTNQVFGIKDNDRLGHIYVIGKTGVGKSTLLENMAISDINRGNGIALIDPHGDIAEDILHHIPEERINDVIYFNPGDIEHPVAFNPLYDIPESEHHMVVAGLLATFKKIWSDSWGPRMEYILRFALLSLLQYPTATLLDIQPLLTDGYFRNKVVMCTADTHIRAFWNQEFDAYTPALKAEAIAPILNKIGVFLASLPLRNSIGQSKSAFTMHIVMNDNKILICNLAKGVIGEDASMLFGSMFVNAIQLAALRRASQDAKTRTPFYLYVDEVHSFVSLSFADILSEARKYGLSLFLAHQYLDQLHEKIKSAIFGNVGTIISFRVGAEDAAYLTQEFESVFSESDFIHLPKYNMYIKLMIDGAMSKPFSADTLPVQQMNDSYKSKIIAHSQLQHAIKKEAVEERFVTNRAANEKCKSHNDTLFDI